MHPDQRLRSYVVQGVKEGFRIGITGGVEGVGGSATNNMPSAKDQPQVIDDYLAEECSRGRVLGQLNQELSPQVQCTLMG